MTQDPNASLRIAVADLNGQARGKRYPAGLGDKLQSGVRLPLSIMNVDVFGADIEDSPLVFESGDADGPVTPTERGPVPMPWLANPATLIPMWMSHDDGRPFAGDPRRALAAVLERYSARGWQVVAATELEFYLVDDDGESLHPPRIPGTPNRLDNMDVLSLDTLDAFDAFFTELYAGCASMGLPAQAAISEGGLGQFEINLNHQDAMRTADDTWLFKMLVRGLARKHGMVATFAAKPFADQPGNGMHVHFSVVDAEGRNVFDNGGPEGTAIMGHALAGCMAAMQASTLIFAPHANSYERLVPESHAPTGISWAFENRTAALRVPGGPPKARRIEHRVAGGDINPYLMLSAVLGAAMIGIEDDMSPPPPLIGNAYDQDLPQLAENWRAAIDAFEDSPLIARIFPADLIAYFVLTKTQELGLMADLSPAAQMRTYLERV